MDAVGKQLQREMLSQAEEARSRTEEEEEEDQSPTCTGAGKATWEPRRVPNKVAPLYGDSQGSGKGRGDHLRGVHREGATPNFQDRS